MWRRQLGADILSASLRAGCPCYIFVATPLSYLLSAFIRLIRVIRISILCFSERVTRLDCTQTLIGENADEEKKNQLWKQVS